MAGRIQRKNMLKPGLDLNETAQFIVVTISGCSALYASTHDPRIWNFILAQLNWFMNGLKKTRKD
ncbi:hypothetical protein [Desulfobacula toluolica]|uniref:Uncharacterized protein n=1 Tax=Desulfobacula toluolica (strain DSM 7467 / Tol2) TaxID=651182 RepID=K0NKM5_DESTT|nr:hypothetical protein [Desulfobacula toluolica]CCK81345.1 uncharacterized protein TOL2_C31870 [Desulfobacula toluolica Tol2]